MVQNLVQLIFEQFLEIVQKHSAKSCFKFHECDFNYRVRESVGHRLLDVIYVVKDKCGRRRDVIITIDITKICLEDLTTCDWVAYLEKLAKEFVSEICPKKYVIIKEEPRKCRLEPAKWCPLPCRNITTVVRRKKIIPVEPEVEVIIEKECECVPICERKPCIPKQEVIIKYETEKPWKCGDVSILVEEDHKKHDFEHFKGQPDFNHHKWGKCCDHGHHDHHGHHGHHGHHDSEYSHSDFYKGGIHH